MMSSVVKGHRRPDFSTIMLILGLVFLYLPMFIPKQFAVPVS